MSSSYRTKRPRTDENELADVRCAHFLKYEYSAKQYEAGDGVTPTKPPTTAAAVAPNAPEVQERNRPVLKTMAPKMLF